MRPQQKRRKLSHPHNTRAAPSTSSFSIPLTRSHPCNVQPLGNLYLSPTAHSCIPPGLGSLLPAFPEPAFLLLLHHFTPSDLCRLSAVSKAFYVYCHEDDYYKQHTLSTYGGSFVFHHSWRLTSVYMHVRARRGQAVAEQLVKAMVGQRPPSITGFYSDLLFQSFYCSAVELERFSNADNIERVHIDDLSTDRFLRHYAVPNRPFIITGLLDRWAASRWTAASLAQRYPTAPFKCGAYAMRLPGYLRYAEQSHDESPLYLFDSAFGEKHPELAAEYEPPVCFKEDLLALLSDLPAPDGYNDDCEDRETPAAHMTAGGGRAGRMTVEDDEKKEAPRESGFGSMRPAYRWILLGPARSGSTFHKVS